MATLTNYRNSSLEEKVDNFSEMMNREATIRGKEDGERALPQILDNQVSPYEDFLRSHFQKLVEEIHSIGGQRLTEVYDSICRPAMLKVESLTPEHIDAIVSEKMEERDRILRDKEIAVQEQAKELHNNATLKTIEGDFRSAEERNAQVCKKHGRKELHTMLSVKMSYFITFLLFLLEIPISYSVLMKLGEPTEMTLLMTFSVITIPFLAHISGRFLRQWRENKMYLVYDLLFLGLVLLFSLYSAQLRAGKAGGVDFSQLNNFYFVLGIIIYLAGLFSAFLAFDPSLEFEKAHENLEDKKKQYRKVSEEVEKQVSELKWIYQVEKEKIIKEYAQYKAQLLLEKKQAERDMHDSQALYNQIRTYYEGLEKKLNQMFLGCIAAYRDSNMKYRQGQQIPRVWGKIVASLEMYFESLTDMGKIYVV